MYPYTQFEIVTIMQSIFNSEAVCNDMKQGENANCFSLLVILTVKELLKIFGEIVLLKIFGEIVLDMLSVIYPTFLLSYPYRT